MKVTIKAARVNAGLKQTEAAEQIGVNPVTLASWEAERTFPRTPQLLKICDVYKCTMRRRGARKIEKILKNRNKSIDIRATV